IIQKTVQEIGGGTGYTDFRGRESERLLLLIMIDALRWDYIARVPYFRWLASQGPTARLREPFGFYIWSPLLCGAEALKGNRFMFVFDPERSPFRFLRAIDPDLLCGTDSRPLIHSTIASRLTKYVKSYASTLDVPLPLLHFFDFGWQQVPWMPVDGHRPITREVAEAGWRWAVLAWPFLNASFPGDHGICEEACQILELRPRFVLVHFQQIDGLGHSFGPGSREVTEACARVGEYVERVLKEAESRYQAVDLLLSGDHGMVATVGSIDLWSRLCRLPLRLGEDYVCFLDSTVARFWFLRRGVREVLVRMLESTPGGRILQAEDLRKYGLDKVGCQNGEMYFLAEPGLVIAPSFFDMKGGILRGMHGYDPGCADNQSVILYHSSQAAKLRFSGEVIDVPEVYSLCRHLLFETRVKRGLEVRAVVPSADMSYCREPAAAGRVRSDLKRILAAVRQEFRDLKAVLLTGSFGRGEGAMWRNAQGKWIPVNDYDLVVVAPTASNQRAVELGRRLAVDLGIDGVDLGVWPSVEDHWASGDVPLFVYDLRYGSQVVWGDADSLAPLSFYSPRQIPLREGVQLLFNRMAGLQLALVRGRCPTDCRYSWNQVIKAAVAACDWYLLLWGDYTTRTTDKMVRFRTLARAAGLAGEDRQIVESYLTRKLVPEYGPTTVLEAELDRVGLFLQETIMAAVTAVTGERYANVTELCRRFPFAAPVTGLDVDIDNQACLEHSADSGWAVRLPEPGFSLRNSLYAALTAMIRAGDGQAAGEDLTRRMVELPLRMDVSGVRSLLVSLWEHWCHSA
ncbi:MAG: alkaline phosphatase family protein, partial [Armatimonadetes bacterium]|nr:alkaline phosphatase family protein [Armatimonadota bacterium]